MSIYAPGVIRPLVMGVLNVTPDSFYDGNRYLDHAAAVRQGHAMLDDGADIVDVGGESTRPGAEPVAVSEERRRVVPVLYELAQDERVANRAVRLSIDTRHAEVAEAGIAAGATMVNDVSASLDVAAVAGASGAQYVAMHAQGTPADMQRNPHYDDVVAEVTEFLVERARGAESAGVTEVYIDPGIGFGKTVEHNLALLHALASITSLTWPVVVGTSRKSWLGVVGAGASGGARLPAEERFEGSLASAMWSMTCGAACVRVHDVRATVDAARLLDAVRAA